MRRDNLLSMKVFGLLCMIHFVPLAAFTCSVPAVRDERIHSKSYPSIIISSLVKQQQNNVPKLNHFQMSIELRRSSFPMFSVLDDDTTNGPASDVSPIATTSETAALKTSSSTTSKESTSSDGKMSSGGVVRTLLLAGPLFCKFVIVLAIKFLTDLVVFPLLFLYRGIRLVKQRVLLIFGIDARKKPNNKKNKDNNENLNGYQPNGSVGTARLPQ